MSSASLPVPRAAARWRPGVWTIVFFAIVAAALVFAVERWMNGLGAVSNLSDRYPWGVWKAFNVLGGVAMGAAGFTIMGTVYVFHARRFQPIVKPAVLMAFLAYSTAAASLVVDIGKSWAIWHPIVMWNPESILFDVAWCLMLYTTVLLLEGSGMLFEKLGWHRIVKIQHAVTVPVVIVGILLSTMHQSSLGALFLIVPGKLHPLWYTESLPILFFISAIAVGFAMVIVLAKLAGRETPALPVPLLSDVARVLVGVLGVYTAVRTYDLISRGAFAMAWQPTYEALMVQIEFVLGVVVPMVMLAFPAVRASAKWMFLAAVLVVMGFIANRLNVSITGFEWKQGGHYVPTLSEMFISVAFVAAAIAAFRWGARFLQVFPSRAGWTSNS